MVGFFAAAVVTAISAIVLAVQTLYAVGKSSGPVRRRATVSPAGARDALGVREAALVTSGGQMLPSSRCSENETKTPCRI